LRSRETPRTRGPLEADLSVVVVSALLTVVSLAAGLLLWALIGSFGGGGDPFTVLLMAGSIAVAVAIVRLRIGLAWPLIFVVLGFVAAPFVFLLLYVAFGGEITMD
jgi:hypothetical protein